MKDTVSIIVPVYNAGDRLNRCLNCICNQTYKNLEILLIDDGSADGSSQVCDLFAERDSRIKVIHQSNHGVSYARNQGLIHMTSKYLMFVDADDYLAEGACEKLVEAIKRYNCDIVTANKVFHKGASILQSILYKKDVIVRDNRSEKDLFILDLMTSYFDPEMNKLFYLSCGVTAKLFKADVIRKNNIRFQEDCRFGEDVLFNLESFQNAEVIGYINYDAYHFCVNAESSTHRFREDWNKSHEIYMDCIDDFIVRYKKDKRFKEAAEMMKVSRISSLAVSFYFHKDNPKSFFAAYKEFELFTKQDKYKSAVRNVKDALLTSNQKKVVLLLRCHMRFLFAVICWIRNRLRKV